MNADKDSPLGQALNRAATKALEGKPDVLHDARVDLIEKVLDIRDDAFEDILLHVPAEFHEPAHRAVTRALTQSLGVLDAGYVVLPYPTYNTQSPHAYVVVPFGEPNKAVDSKTFNVAGDLAVIFSTIYDDINT